MKASEARKIAEAYSSSKDVDLLWDALVLKMKARAEKGFTFMVHPYAELKGKNTYCSAEEQSALERRLVTNGYKVINHSNPDPGHPASSAYTEVLWE